MDGELSLPERGMVEAHLAACDACALHLEQLAAVDVAMRALPAEAPGDYFDTFPARLRTRLRQPATSARAPRRVPAWAWAAAAALVVALITPLTLRETSFESPGGPAPAAAPQAPAMRTDDTLAPPPQSEARRARGFWPFDKRAGDDASSAPVAPARQAPRPESTSSPADGDVVREPVTVLKSARADESAQSEQVALGRAEPGPAPVAPQSDDAHAPGADFARPDGVMPAAPPASARVEPAPDPGGRNARVAAQSNESMQGVAVGGGLLAEGRAERDARRDAAASEDEEGPSAQDAAGTPGTTDSAQKAGAPRPRTMTGANRARTGSSGDEEFETLRARTATDLDTARELRDLWRAFAARNPAGTRGDLARLQVIEAGYRAFRLGRDGRDREVLVRDARTYLEREDGQHGTRVRALLADAERP